MSIIYREFGIRELFLDVCRPYLKRSLLASLSISLQILLKDSHHRLYLCAWSIWGFERLALKSDLVVHQQYYLGRLLVLHVLVENQKVLLLLMYLPVSRVLLVEDQTSEPVTSLWRTGSATR